MKTVGSLPRQDEAEAQGLAREFDDAARSCASHLFFCQLTRRHYWAAAGRPAETWATIESEVRQAVKSSTDDGSVPPIRLVMVGCSPQTATPHILLETDDSRLKTMLLRNERLIRIMKIHPDIGIDINADVPERPALHGPPPSSSTPASSDLRAGQRRL
ncbi:hypothetical protein GQ53DRAFT_826916 [Thozetella sp. PMI_491]|nr:hypothetical protein GQ53DRAFT_826916 [Thozetella sp. PMI_491]